MRFRNGIKSTIKVDSFSPAAKLTRFPPSRSRGVSNFEKGIEFPEREADFPEKTTRAAAAYGVHHRMPKNAERIENGHRE